MLSSLYIENIAVIRRLSVDLTAGFTAVTGETGAGKSVILEAIKLLLGGKADRELIRHGEETGSVSAVFGTLGAAAEEALSAAGIDPDEEGSVQVRRVISNDGKSRAWINGQPVSLSLLRDVGRYLVDVHGQNENLTLLDEKTYVATLDGYAGLRDRVAAYRAVYNDLCDVRRRLSEFDRGEAERLRTVEMLKYQIADVDAVNPKPGEDAALEEKETKIKNREKIVRQTSFVYRALKGAERGSVLFLLDKSAQALEPLSSVIPEIASIAEELNDCRYRIEDAAERVYDLSDADEGDPTAVIDKIEGRLDAFSKLKKKYGGTIEEVLRFRDEAKKRLAELDASDDTVIELRESEKKLSAETRKLALSLHAERKKAAKELEKKITDILLYLDMPKVVFRVDVLDRGENGLKADGCDDVLFVLSANAGDEPRPLSLVASGGELARTFLALKCVLSERALTPTMIFDEIDTGVSGKTARKIGYKLAELSKGTQVFAVTHSAQIASLSDTHLLIRKEEKNGKTETGLTSLDREGRIAELSRILGGLTVTESQRNAARDMLEGKETDFAGE